MRSSLSFLAMLLFSVSAFSQQIHGDPDLDPGITETKQFKRYKQFTEARSGGGNVADISRWNAWHRIDNDRAGGTQPWQNYGPDTVSGRIISIAFHPTDSNTIVVGAASGGLWKTTDLGNTWECVTDDYFTMGVGAVAYNPLNPNSIIIVTGEAYGFGGEFTGGYGVFKSLDGGDTWNQTGLQATLDQSFAGTDVYWNPSDTNLVTVASTYGIYQSYNGGMNYTPTLDRIGGRMVVDPQDPNKLFFAARYYNATFPGGLWVSTDSGTNWSTTGTGLPMPNHFGFSSIAIHPVHNNIMYVAVANSAILGTGPMEGLYKSVDNGATFTEVNSNQDIFCYPPPYENLCLGWYANTLTIHPTDTNRLFAGGTRLWTSADCGETWATVDVQPATFNYWSHPDHHQTLFHPITGELFDCNDGGVDRSDDLGVTWTAMGEGLITHQFYSIASAETDPDIVIGGTQDVGTLWSTTAHNGNWQQEISGDSFGHLIDHSDADVWYGTNYINRIRMKTTDAGANWAEINDGTSMVDQWRMPFAMHPVDNQTLLSSNSSALYKTTNGGNFWTAVANVGDLGTIVFDEIDPNIVYAHELDAGTLYRSTDGGDNWFQLANSPGSPVREICVDPQNSGTLYAAIGTFAQNAQVYRSTDQGANWTNISSDLPAVPANTVAVCDYDDQQIYVGTDIGVWVTLDGGSTWETFNEGLPAAVVVEDLHFYEPDNTVRIGTYGRGYWRAPALTHASSMLDISNSDIRIYPNPGKGVFWLSKVIDHAQVVDLTNRVVSVIKDSDQVDLSGLKSGIYILVWNHRSYKLLKV